MNRIDPQSWKADLPEFREKTTAFYAGDLDKMAYKGFSGLYGSYAQKGGKASMLRLRMTACLLYTSLVEIAAVDHIHWLYILVIIVDAGKFKLHFGPASLYVCAQIRTAVNVSHLIPEYLFDVIQIIQGEIIGHTHIIDPVADLDIGLGDPHVLIKILEQSPHGIADGHNGDHRANADDDAQHGEEGTHLIGLYGVEGHGHIFDQHTASPFLP